LDRSASRWITVFGGLRPVLADIAWLKMSAAWEKRDDVATVRWIGIATKIDPLPLYFWINGARIVAYDLTEWRLGAMRQSDELPQVQARIVREQAMRALDRLDAARLQHPGVAAIWIERANIQYVRLGDVSGAAESYRQAARCADAPYFAARLHAELLRRSGDRVGALDWLVLLHPTLPAGVEAAAPELVLARIRALEDELGVAATARFQPAPAKSPF
jgi:hypothetical protein